MGREKAILLLGLLGYTQTKDMYYRVGYPDVYVLTKPSALGYYMWIPASADFMSTDDFAIWIQQYG